MSSFAQKLYTSSSFSKKENSKNRIRNFSKNRMNNLFDEETELVSVAECYNKGVMKGKLKCCNIC